MFGKDKLQLCSFILWLTLVLPSVSKADERHNVYFELKPKSCITITKGKDCYGNFTLSWRLERARNVCLFVEAKDRPVFCWSKRTSGEHTGAFVLSKSAQYSLVDVESKEVLFTDTVVVTWVYKDYRKRRRWRLF